MKLKQQENITAIYCRLSKDDEYQGDSMSIQNQRAMLTQYAKDKGLTNLKVYVDDGFSGTNYERPNFKKMIKDIEDGKVGTVIVKDLSRLGREYLQTGYYTEIFFPQNDVRFIAVNDNVDSDNGENEFAPFKNIINEWYAKDISKKIKASLYTKALNGDCSTGKVPYGYSKDPDNKTRYIPNDCADNVKMIFQWEIEGCSCGEIAGKLTKLGIPTPAAYYYMKRGKEKDGSYLKRPDLWLITTVKGILMNPVYTGKTVAHRSTFKSFKDKRKVALPQEEWIVTEGTHEALVSQEDYDTVYKRLSSKSRSRVDNPDNIFKSLVWCPECGKRHAFTKRLDKSGSKGVYSCQTASKYGRKYCSFHYITLKQLHDVVLSDIRLHAKLAKENSGAYYELLTSAADAEKVSEKNLLLNEAEKAKKRIAELDILIQKLYEDMTFGVLSKERYIKMSQDMENELATLKARSIEIAGILNENEKIADNAARFTELIEKYTDITELDYELIHTLIEKIYIHERENINGKTIIKVDIYYRFIGNISDSDNPTEVYARYSTPRIYKD